MEVTRMSTTIILLLEFLLSEFVTTFNANGETRKDYYKLLGINSDATEQDIGKAFRKLAIKFHPDKNPSNKKEAEEKFKEIAEAYGVLSNAERRREYDNGGRQTPFGNQGFDFNFDDFFRNFDFGDDFGGTHFSFGHGDGGRHAHRHAQHHHRHHEGRRHHHPHPANSFFTFQDFFNDDEDSSTFSESHRFGGGDSFFGSHFNGGGDSFHQVHHRQSHGSSCKTVTQRVGNMVTTYTQCS